MRPPGKNARRLYFFTSTTTMSLLKELLHLPQPVVPDYAVNRLNCFSLMSRLVYLFHINIYLIYPREYPEVGVLQCLNVIFITRCVGEEIWAHTILNFI